MVVNDVVLNLTPGTITVVVGESGAGKTTLLKALAGLESGDVQCGPKACVYVQQQPVVFTNSVGAELMLTHRLFPIFRLQERRTDLFQLNELANQGTAELSGGERQRVVLARQFSLAPSLLLLDECTRISGGFMFKRLNGNFSD